LGFTNVRYTFGNNDPKVTSSAEALRNHKDQSVKQSAVEGNKTVFLTSTFPKEGKTFVAANLAATFALSGKRVLFDEWISETLARHYLDIPERGLLIIYLPRIWKLRTLSSSTKDMMISTFCLQVSFHQTRLSC
jgi:hypothetical protein